MHSVHKLIIYVIFFLMVFQTIGDCQNINFKINSIPDRASIFLNDKLIGTTPYSGKIKFSFKEHPSYDLILKKEGFRSKVHNYGREQKLTPGDDYDILIDDKLDRVTKKFDSVDNFVVSFEKMLYDIKPSTIIGQQKYSRGKSPVVWSRLYENQGELFTKEAEDVLENSGFKVARKSKLFASAKLDRNRDLILGATLRNIEVNYATLANLSYANISVKTKVEWQLFSVRKSKIIGTISTTGESYLEKGDVYLTFGDALNEAITKLMYDSTFIQKINEFKTKSTRKDIGSVLLTKADTPAFKDYSSMVLNTVKSVVTIKSNQGHGSGFFISEDGNILTNFHVVDQSKDLRVILNAGFSLPAELVSYDEDFDIAVIKVNGDGFKPLFLKNGEEAPIGSEVVVIGTPTDIAYGQSVSKGIISGFRDFDGKKYYQTDASVNPGNSGGPMLNIKGEVLGIVSRKSRDSEGIGFAIPTIVAIEKLGIIFK